MCHALFKPKKNEKREKEEEKIMADGELEIIANYYIDITFI